MTINDRFNIDAGIGITWIRLIKKQKSFYTAEAFDKLISTQTEKILQIKAYGIDGKIQFNYALNPHIQVHLFGQYRVSEEVGSGATRISMSVTAQLLISVIYLRLIVFCHPVANHAYFWI